MSFLRFFYCSLLLKPTTVEIYRTGIRIPCSRFFFRLGCGIIAEKLCKGKKLMGKIQSSTISAADAISELVDLDTSNAQNQQVEFSYTTGIAGMEAGRQACNQMLQAVSDFSSAVLIQTNKIPEIAAKIEKRDIEEAKRWES